MLGRSSSPFCSTLFLDGTIDLATSRWNTILSYLQLFTCVSGTLHPRGSLVSAVTNLTRIYLCIELLTTRGSSSQMNQGRALRTALRRNARSSCAPQVKITSFAAHSTTTRRWPSDVLKLPPHSATCNHLHSCVKHLSIVHGTISLSKSLQRLQHIQTNRW